MQSPFKLAGTLKKFLTISCLFFNLNQVFGNQFPLFSGILPIMFSFVSYCLSNLLGPTGSNRGYLLESCRVCLVHILRTDILYPRILYKGLSDFSRVLLLKLNGDFVIALKRFLAITGDVRVFLKAMF